MQHIDTGWRTSDAVQLYAQAWQPDGTAKAVVCLVHGLGEHSGRYHHVAEFLTRAGYVLLAYDLRGHGQSQGRRGHSPTYDAMLDDIGQLLEEATRRYPGLPHFLYGHSLGGNLVINYVLRRQPSLAGVVASAPGLRTASPLPAVKLALGRALYRLWPTFLMANGLDRQGLSRDPAVVQAYNADPLVHDRISARFGLDFINAGAWAIEHASEFKLPLLLMCGSQDRLVSVDACREFAAGMGGGCTLKIWDGLYHEIHNEPEKEQVLAYLLGWLKGLA